MAILMGIDKKPLDEQLDGAGATALPRNLMPRYCGNSGTQVTGGSSSVLDSFNAMSIDLLSLIPSEPKHDR